MPLLYRKADTSAIKKTKMVNKCMTFEWNKDCSEALLMRFDVELYETRPKVLQIVFSYDTSKWY